MVDCEVVYFFLVAIVESCELVYRCLCGLLKRLDCLKPLLALLLSLRALLRLPLRLAEMGEPVIYGGSGANSRLETAIRLPLLAPARLLGVKEPACVLLNPFASRRVRVGVRPALGGDVESGRAGATGAAVALGIIEILTRGALLLPLITLVTSLDLVVARLGGELARQSLEFCRSILLSLLGFLLGVEGGTLLLREVSGLLLGP
jgi:hypothetical protein